MNHKDYNETHPSLKGHLMKNTILESVGTVLVTAGLTATVVLTAHGVSKLSTKIFGPITVKTQD